ncbi:CrcB protein [Microbacterium testaceum]|nr:CrcB protein [Microbacterium sp. SORGH_AS_0969]MDQ1114812.1 CrcB protein [Microbacterium testaceum]
MSMWRDVVLVAVGGAIGTAARAGLTLALGDDLGPALVPLVNVVGAFAIGVVFGFRARMPESSRAQRAQLFLGTGVLGGFTTYSALAVESADLTQLWWGAATVVVGTAAAWGGVVLGRGRLRSR